LNCIVPGQPARPTPARAGRAEPPPRSRRPAENLLAPRAGFRHPAGEIFTDQRPLPMKAKIIVTPKKAVLDPQGKTVQNALAHLGYTGVTGVHIGKYIEIDLAPGTDKAAAERALNDAARKFLSNPIIEDYKLEIAD
jgi:phosphoribosylformylglycinamidine synthase PurS subunit